MTLGSSTQFTQQNRLIAIDTPLGDDVLLLQSFVGHEGISRLFSFELELLSTGGAVDFTKIMGKNVTIAVMQADNTPRYFNGLVSRFTQSGSDAVFSHYQMEVVPWTWMLTRQADCRIFHNKKVQDIIEQIFKNHGFTDYKISLNGSYSAMEYCVQYRETDFNFVSRLMEQNGIFYFFKHEEKKHTMVIGDSSSAHEACPGQKSAGYNLVTGGLDDEDVVNSWAIEQELRTGKYSLTDYNFKTPSASLLATETSIVSVGDGSKFEIFDFPGEYSARGEGTNFAKLRMQEEEAGHLLAHGSSVCRAFATGYKFDLEDHPHDPFNDTYILTEIQHIASVAGSYNGSGGGSESGGSYTNHFTCIPEDVVFRPARLTPKPFAQGPQTAMVVGKGDDSDSADDDDTGGDGEEIWVDKYGRVMVLFPWDRKSDCSCWVRASQDWAGNGWGMINIPRVGQEVIVSFLEGDPDRPIITGRVYNAEQVVPYKLPDYGTRTTFKTRSTTGGSDDNYNELRFEDKTGSEQVFVRGEKDYDTRIKNDSREWIGNNQSVMVQKDRLEKVTGNESIQIGGNRTEKVTGDESIQIGGKRMEKVTGDVSLQIQGKQSEKITGDMNHNVSGNWNQKTAQNVSIQAGENMYEKSGQNYAHEAGMAIHIKAGMTMVLEAGMQLSLKAGSSFIDIGPAGIAISGAPLVMINSGGAAGSGSGSSPTDPAAPDDPKDPADPDEADDGTKGTKMNG